MTAGNNRFVAMVTAKADVDLRLSDFHPLSKLVAPDRTHLKARFPAIDYHNHLDSMDPATVLRLM